MKKLFFPLSLLILFSLTATTAQELSYTGWAHYYSDHFQGRTTAYGEKYDRFQLTCANLKFPKNTLLRVTRLDNGKSVVVRVNDKGPFTKPDPDGTEYIIDLSLAAANAIDLTVVGETIVRIEAIGFSATNPGASSGLVAGSPATYDGGFTARGSGNPVNNYDGSSFPGDFTQIKTIQPGIPGYGIQVGSYTNKQNAERQVVSLQKMGVQHLYLMSHPNANGQLVHQLIIAKFDTKDQADLYKVQIEGQYLLKGFVKKL